MPSDRHPDAPAFAARHGLVWREKSGEWRSPNGITVVHRAPKSWAVCGWGWEADELTALRVAMARCDLPDALQAENEALRADAERLRELVAGMVKWADSRPGIEAPEDPDVLALCERVGFGAVMDSAARQWQRRDPLGAFVVGPCLATARRAVPRG